jgi:PAS domain S-box-containing protein
MWFKNKYMQPSSRELTREKKAALSQAALIAAVTAAANAAEEVTSMLKSRLDDTLRQIETTAQLLPDALIIINSSGKVDTANLASARIFGWSPEKMQGIELSELFRDDLGNEMSSASIMNRFLFCREGSLELEETMQCVRGHRQNGSLFWVEINISHVYRTTSDPITLLLCRDASRRLDTKQQLELKDLKFSNIFEFSNDSILVVGGGKILAANPASSRLFRTSITELVGSSVDEYITSHGADNLNMPYAYPKSVNSDKNILSVRLTDSSDELLLTVQCISMPWDKDSTADLIIIKPV